LVGVVFLLGGVGPGPEDGADRADHSGHAKKKESDSAAVESPGIRRLSKEINVRAPLDDVWHSWSTSEGIAKFFSSDSRIEVRVGGPYECYFGAEPDADGKRGSQGCRVLSFVPREMLSFEWNFPPAVPELRSKGAKTHVVLRFQDMGNGEVKIRFDQLGWGQGEAWDKGYVYFDRAWGHVLRNLKNHLEGRDKATRHEKVGQMPRESD
jgi:uncharacterized protein YndB with AHSA1/START domain